jgi:hypothetical protein
MDATNVLYTRTIHTQLGNVKDDIQVKIPQHKAGESNEPEKSLALVQNPDDNSLKERETTDDVDNDNLEMESDSSTGQTPAESTRLGQTITRPRRLIEESGVHLRREKQVMMLTTMT